MDQKVEDLLKQLDDLMKKYKKNKENISLDVLQTRYKEPWTKLKASMKDIALKILTDYCLSDIEVNPADKEDIAKIVEAYEGSDIGEQIGRAIFKHADVESFKKILREHRRRCIDAYIQYVRKNSYICMPGGESSGPMIYNSILDKYYSPDKDAWISEPMDKMIFITAERKKK